MPWVLYSVTRAPRGHNPIACFEGHSSPFKPRQCFAWVRGASPIAPGCQRQRACRCVLAGRDQANRHESAGLVTSPALTSVTRACFSGCHGCCTQSPVPTSLVARRVLRGFFVCHGCCTQSPVPASLPLGSPTRASRSPPCPTRQLSSPVRLEP